MLYKVVIKTGFDEIEVFGPKPMSECINFIITKRRLDRLYRVRASYDIVKHVSQ